MGNNALSSLTKDKRVLAVIVVAIVVIAAVAVWAMTRDSEPEGPANNMTIDSERTISDDLEVKGTLTIGEKGVVTLSNGAEIRMIGPDAKIDVKGTLDATHGEIVFYEEDEKGEMNPVYENGDKETRSITVTGELILDPSNFLTNVEVTQEKQGVSEFVNSALYVNSDKDVVLTTLSKALSAMPKDTKDEFQVIIMGTYNDTAAITLADKAMVILYEGASVTLGTVTVDGGVFDTSMGKLTGAVKAKEGSYTMTAAGGIMFTSYESHIIASGDLSGKMAVDSGAVYMNKVDLTTGSTLTVNAGGTLVLAELGTGGSEAKGILAAPQAASNADEQIIINGVMVLGIQPTAKATGDTGPFHTTESNSTVSGSVKIGESGYVKQYADSKAAISGAKSTAFYIDSAEYMTVYGTCAIKDVLAGEKPVEAIVKADDFAKVANWNNTENMSGTAVADATALAATGYEKVYYATVKVELTLTQDENVSLLIDGNPINSSITKIVLAAGTHNVELRASGDYTCSFSVDDSSVKLQSGKGTFEVSSTTKALKVTAVSTATPADTS